jgi:hypothetical protein
MLGKGDGVAYAAAACSRKRIGGVTEQAERHAYQHLMASDYFLCGPCRTS